MRFPTMSSLNGPALALALLLPALAGVGAGAGAAHAACREDRAELITPGGMAAFRVEIADDPAERQLGLMNRPSMPTGQGMLFVFEAEQPRAFWMHNTLIPLDILFFDATGTLVTIQHGKPQDDTTLPGGMSQYVLEINGGLAERMGITEGTVLRHPAIDPAKAAAVCD